LKPLYIIKTYTNAHRNYSKLYNYVGVLKARSCRRNNAKVKNDTGW